MERSDCRVRPSVCVSFRVGSYYKLERGAELQNSLQKNTHNSLMSNRHCINHESRVAYSSISHGRIIKVYSPFNGNGPTFSHGFIVQHCGQIHFRSFFVSFFLLQFGEKKGNPSRNRRYLSLRFCSSRPARDGQKKKKR